MNLRDYFGTTDGQDDSAGPDSEQSANDTEEPPASEVFGDSELSERQLRQRIRQANQEFEKADGRLKAFQKKARKLLVGGSGEDSDNKRKVIAVLARQVKQRAAVMKLKQQAALRDLFKYTLQKEVQSIQEMLKEELNRESPMEHLDVDSDEFTEEFNEVAASVQAQTEEMTEMLQEVSSSVEGADTDLALDTFPEEEEMDRIAEAEADAAEEAMEFDVELEEPAQDTTAEAADGPDVGLDFDDAAGVGDSDDDDDDLARSLAS